MSEVWLPEMTGAPPGTKPNYINPENQTKITVVVHTISLTVVTLSLALRLYTRNFIVHRLGIDDYLCVLAWPLTCAYSGLSLYADSKGLSRHTWDFDWQKNGATSLKAFSIGIYLCLVLGAIIKLACLFFYRTIFLTSRKTMRFITAGIFLVAVAFLGLIIYQSFQCSTIISVENRDVSRTCRSASIVAFLNGGINIFTDIYVLVVPLPALWALPLKAGRKLKVIAVFSCGLLACVVTIVRLAVISKVFRSRDLTWIISSIEIWGCIENNTCLMVVCLLVLPAFLKRHWPKRFNGCILQNLRVSVRLETGSTTLTGVRTWKGDQQTTERSQSSRPDEFYLSTNNSTDEDEYANENATALSRFNMTRPLSDPMLMEPPPVHLPSNNKGHVT